MPELVDLQLSIDGFVATITLDRPDARNAYSVEMIQSLLQTLDELDLRSDVRAVVLTGAGTAFSAGGDLKLMREREGMFAGDAVDLRARYLQGIHQIPRRIERFNKPIVAAINGAAIGAGLDLACMCDIRICAERAKFGSTFVKVGLVPGDGGAYLLSRVVGYPIAMEMILTGDVIRAERALQIGLVNEVTEDPLASARAMAARIAQNPPIAVRLAKSALQESWAQDLHRSLNIAATHQGIAQNTSDHLEAVNALLEKRAGTYEGK